MNRLMFEKKLEEQSELMAQAIINNDYITAKLHADIYKEIEKKMEERKK